MHARLNLPLYPDFSLMCVGFCGLFLFLFFFSPNKTSGSNLPSVHVKQPQKKIKLPALENSILAY